MWKNDINNMFCSNPCWQLSTTQPLAYCPPWWDGERTGRVKVRKLMGWDKDSLVGKAKAMHASKAKPEIRSLLAISRQLFSHRQESRAPACLMVTWEDKCHHSKRPCVLSSFLSFTCWTWHHMVWNIPLVSWGQLSQLCPLPALCATCWWGGGRSRKGLDSVWALLSSK